MKSGGQFNELFDRWNDEHKVLAAGFAVACVGTKRVRYASEADEWTPDENAAKVWPDSIAAAMYLATLSKDIFGYCRVVATMRDPKFGRQGLPTVNGY